MIHMLFPQILNIDHPTGILDILHERSIPGIFSSIYILLLESIVGVDDFLAIIIELSESDLHFGIFSP